MTYKKQHETKRFCNNQERTCPGQKRIEAKESMLDANPELKGMYSANDDNTEVLYLENAKATFCSFTELPKVVEF